MERASSTELVGEVEDRERGRRAWPSLPRRYSEVFVVAAVLALLWLNGLGPYDSILIATAAAYLVAGVGMNVLVGFVGLASVGHAGFLAIGAYTWALTEDNVGIAGAGALAIAITVAVAVVVGLFVLRFRSYYFALATLAFGAAVTAAIVSFPGLTNGSAGMALDFDGTVSDSLYFAAAALATLALVLQHWLRHSSLGVQLLALRGNQAAASSLGMDRTRLELAAFVLSAVLAGVAGCLLAEISGYVSPSQFGFQQSVVLLVIPIIGGRGWLWAPALGAAIAVWLPDYARFLGSGRLIVYGLLLFFVSVFFPAGVRGIADWLGDLWRRLREPRRAEATDG